MARMLLVKMKAVKNHLEKWNGVERKGKQCEIRHHPANT
jgi:hypothetical protein